MFFYHNAKDIIDCTEVLMETPSSLVVQACLYSAYKHHCTVKIPVVITPNRILSWISRSYGSRICDHFIFRDFGFLDLLEPGDQVIADWGFKTKTDLAIKEYASCIAPSAAK